MIIKHFSCGCSIIADDRPNFHREIYEGNPCHVCKKEGKVQKSLEDYRIEVEEEEL